MLVLFIGSLLGTNRGSLSQNVLHYYSAPLSRPHTPSFCFIHHQVLRVFCCVGRGAQRDESPGLLLEGVGLAAGQGQRVDFRSSEVLSQAFGQGTSVSG